MEGKKCFAVVGGDARQAAAARALARAGYSVGGPEMIAVADYILLPLPLDAARTPLAELLRAARPGTLALGGMLSVEKELVTLVATTFEWAEDIDTARAQASYERAQKVLHSKNASQENGDLLDHFRIHSLLLFPCIHWLYIVIIAIVIDIHRIPFPFRRMRRAGWRASALLLRRRALPHTRLTLRLRFRLGYICLDGDLFAALRAKRGGASHKGSAAIGTILHRFHSLSEFPAQSLFILRDRSR